MNKHGLYSKAASLIRAMPQERGTVEQMVAAAKAKGLKEAELANAGPLPAGKISREDLAQMFEARLPSVEIAQYGDNPSYLSRLEQMERKALQEAKQGPLMDFEEKRLADLNRRAAGAVPINVMMQGEDDDGNADPESPVYEGYQTDGGKNYRERLLKLDQPEHPALKLDQMIRINKHQTAYQASALGEDHPIVKNMQKRLGELQAERDRAVAQLGEPKGPKQRYQSSHWGDHPDVIAHIRMQDRTVNEDRDSVRPLAEKLATALNTSVRDLSSGSARYGVQNGLISPQEAASLSRVMGWYNGFEGQPGVGKRLLHVEELQSDWGQEGRDKGFRDPDKPFRLWNKSTGKTVSDHATNDEAWDAYIKHPDRNSLDYGPSNNPPVGPYVQNTQHWTDLALKNVLREAAMGNYDGVVFTPGQAQADRYGLEKQVDNLSYHPNTKTLMAMKGNNTVFRKEGVEPEEIASHVGRDVSQKLLHPTALHKFEDGDQFYNIFGDDLKMGGQGMKGYYDQIVPKSVMRLAQMHDPDVKPAEPISMRGEGNTYQGFHLPMTDKLKQGILNDGFPAFRRGGSVDAALAATRRFTKDGQHVTMWLKD